MLRASGIPAQSHRHKPADTIRLGSIGIYGKSDMLNMYLIWFVFSCLPLPFLGFCFLFLASAFFFWLLLSFFGFWFSFVYLGKIFEYMLRKIMSGNSVPGFFSIVFVILVVCCCLESLFWRWIWIPDGQELFWVFFFLCIFLPLIIYFIGFF